MKSAAYIFIYGFVQGVGFRQFIKNKAGGSGLRGWVKNTSSGDVEAFLCGDKKKIDNVIRFCKKGPMLAKVKHVRVEWSKNLNEKDDFNGFMII